MPVLIAEPLATSDEQRVALGRMARSSSLPHRQGVQAKHACAGPIENVGIDVFDAVPESRQNAPLPICDEEFARVIALDHHGRRRTVRDDLL